MKKAFTMIELIFVIVIIGILAAVAIPKLAATRDDATIANIITNARTLLRDASSYYTSQGPSVWNTVKAATVSSVVTYINSDCSTYIDPENDAIIGTFYLCDERAGNPCLQFDINQTAINIQAAPAGVSSICNGVVGDPAIIGITGGADNNKTTTLGGASVVR